MALTLTTAEQARLDQAEAVIECYSRQFIRVAEELAAIRDGQLYRTTYGTFEEYCAGRWGWGARRARQIMAAAEVAEQFVPLGLPPPATEGVARALGEVPEDERAEVWAEATAEAGPKGPTAARVEQIAAKARAALGPVIIADGRAKALAKVRSLVSRIERAGAGLDPGERDDLADWLGQMPDWLR